MVWWLGPLRGIRFLDLRIVVWLALKAEIGAICSLVFLCLWMRCQEMEINVK